MGAAWDSSLHVMRLKCRKEKIVDQINEKNKKERAGVSFPVSRQSNSVGALKSPSRTSKKPHLHFSHILL